MSTSIDLSGQDDVYANIPPDYESTSAARLHEIQIVSDAMPTVLARVFGLLSTMSIVPLSTSSSLNRDGTIKISIHVTGVDPFVVDRFLRKVSQLIETVSAIDSDLTAQTTTDYSFKCISSS